VCGYTKNLCSFASLRLGRKPGFVIESLFPAKQQRGQVAKEPPHQATCTHTKLSSAAFVERRERFSKLFYQKFKKHLRPAASSWITLRLSAGMLAGNTP
jgi:hypothetical protein